MHVNSWNRNRHIIHIVFDRILKKWILQTQVHLSNSTVSFRITNKTVFAPAVRSSVICYKCP